MAGRLCLSATFVLELTPIGRNALRASIVVNDPRERCTAVGQMGERP